MTEGNISGRARLNMKAPEGVREQETPGKQIVAEEEAGGILFRLVSSGAVLVNATDDDEDFHYVINPNGRDNYKCHLRDGVFTHARNFREKHWQKTVEVEQTEKEAKLNAGHGGTVFVNAPSTELGVMALLPGYTDEDGDRWDFFQHSTGLWVSVCASMMGESISVNEKERGEVADKLRAWLQETGRR